MTYCNTFAIVKMSSIVTPTLHHHHHHHQQQQQQLNFIITRTDIIAILKKIIYTLHLTLYSSIRVQVVKQFRIFKCSLVRVKKTNKEKDQLVISKLVSVPYGRAVT